MRSVFAALALLSSANAQSGYRCAIDFAGSCPASSPGPIQEATVECGCSTQDPAIPCDDQSQTVCCKPPTCATGFDDSECTGRVKPLGPTCTPSNDGSGVACTLANDGCEPSDGCDFKTGDQVKAETECEWGLDGSAQCTAALCCEPSTEPATDCEGFYAACDDNLCQSASQRIFTAQVDPAHGGRACPEPKNCYDEPAAALACLPKSLPDDANCRSKARAECEADEACSFQPAYLGQCTDQCTEDLCTAGVSTLNPDGASCDGACTEADCCVPNSCSFAPRCVGDGDASCELNADQTGCSGDETCRFQTAQKVIGTVGYYAENPDETTVAGLGKLGCSTGKKYVDPDDMTSVGGFIGQPYDVRVTCPEDGGSFQWEGCTEAANCYGTANREKSEATCEAKGLKPSCEVVGDLPISCTVDPAAAGTCIATCTGVSGDCTSVGLTLPPPLGPPARCEYNANDAGQPLVADENACSKIQGAALADATECERVITAGLPGRDEGDCGGGVQCRTINPATCTIPDDTCPSTPCVFEDGNSDLEPRRGCPSECIFSGQTGQACDYTPAVLSDVINMQDLGDHVQDTSGDESCARIDPDGRLSHFDSCKVECEVGYHLVESKRDEHKNRISNPKYWRPLHPQCDNGILHFSVSCEEDTDWTGVLIIVLVLGFFLVLIPVVKYMRVVGAYNKDKAAGCTWAPDGSKSDPAATSDEAAD